MRCRKCRAKWDLQDHLMGGNASPGQHSLAALGCLVAGSAGFLIFETLTAELILLLAAIGAIPIFVMGLLSCGFQQTTTAYQGSFCPRCGHRNWIWPWNF